METEKLRIQRDRLLGKLCPLLENRGIDYVVFKTINRFGAVGVDVDVMINYRDFDMSTNLLQTQGFRPIDDLSKKYATGFMIGDNPIIIDLHTELAVLGVRYLSSKSLLSSKKRVLFASSDGAMRFEINVLNEVMEAIVRMSHSVIKEGSITLADIIEPTSTLANEASLVSDYAKREGLQTAITAFVEIAASIFGGIYSKSLDIFNQSVMDLLARTMVSQAITSGRFPVKLPRILSIDALFSRLKNQDEMTNYLPLVITSLKYKRNIEQLSRKVLGWTSS